MPPQEGCRHKEVVPAKPRICMSPQEECIYCRTGVPTYEVRPGAPLLLPGGTVAVSMAWCAAVTYLLLRVEHISTAYEGGVVYFAVTVPIYRCNQLRSTEPVMPPQEGSRAGPPAFETWHM